jgi:prepilin-type N-terminal cleavage/methylation domain-containing protein
VNSGVGNRPRRHDGCRTADGKDTDSRGRKPAGRPAIPRASARGYQVRPGFLTATRWSNGARGSRTGFTLVELTATLLLAALLSAAVAASLAGTRRGALLEDVVARWKAYDEASRVQARLSGEPVRLRIDVDAGRVRRLDEAGASPLGSALDLPAGAEGVRVERVVTAADDPAAGRGATAGEVDVPVSVRGYSPAYAVLLAGPGGRRQWLMFAGLTGEPRTLADEREVVETFRLLRGGVGPSERSE